jgi:Ni/Co efflux regulator RcnB
MRYLIAAAVMCLPMTAHAEDACRAYWDEIEYSANRHGSKVVTFSPAQRELVTENFNNEEPKSDVHPAKIGTYQRMGQTYLLFAGADGCMISMGKVSDEELANLLAPKQGG